MTRERTVPAVFHSPFKANQLHAPLGALSHTNRGALVPFYSEES